MRTGWLILVLAVSLGGCAAGGPPLVDMTDVNPVVYQRDLDQCQVEARSVVDLAGPIVVGAIAGATIGMGFGALLSTPVSWTAIGYGGAAGAVAGAGISAATSAGWGADVSAAADAPPAAPPPPRQSLADCIAAHGYKVIAPAPQ